MNDLESLLISYLRPTRAAKNTKPSLHITPDVLEESNSYMVGSNSGGLR